MKILLIKYHENESISTRLPESINQVKGILPPLGLLYIASYLEKHGYEVKILDIEALNLTSEEGRELILKEKADIVGITSSTSTLLGSFEAAKFAKESGAVVVLGGPQINAYPIESTSHPFIDYSILGEGEETMLELTQAIEKNDKGKIETIGGLVYKKGGEVISNGARITEDLDKLPFPSWHLLDLDKYDCIISEKPFITMITARGCPFQCGYCFKQPADKKYRMRSAKNVVDEIEECIKKYKIKKVMFYEDTLTLKKDHVREICNIMIERKLNIKWEAPTRVDCVDEDLLMLMKKAGCIRLRFGVESGDPRILEVMKRTTRLETVEKVFKICDKIGIETFAYFIIGYYSETPESMDRTINFAQKINPDWAMFNVATPLPKTNLFDITVKDGLIDGNYWSDVALGKKRERLPYLVKDANKWAKKAYMKFYFRPKFIFKKIRKLNSFSTLRHYVQGAKAIVLMS